MKKRKCKTWIISGVLLLTGSFVTRDAFLSKASSRPTERSLPIRGPIPCPPTGIQTFQFVNDADEQDQILHVSISDSHPPLRVDLNGRPLGIFNGIEEPEGQDLRLWIPKERLQEAQNELRFQSEENETWTLSDLYLTKATPQDAQAFDVQALLRGAKNLYARHRTQAWAQQRARDYLSRALMAADRDDGQTQEILQLLNWGDPRPAPSLERSWKIPVEPGLNPKGRPGLVKKSKKMAQLGTQELEWKRLFLEGYAMELTHPAKALERYLLVVHRAPKGSLFWEKAQKRLRLLLKRSTGVITHGETS